MMNKEVTLRAIEPEDLDLLYMIENDREIWDVGVTNVPYSRYSLREYINGIGDIYTDHQLRLIIETQGQTIGIADLTSFDAKNRKAEVGLVIMRDYRGQGYASEVLRQLEAYALTVLHLHQIYACVPIDNEASTSLFRKFGYYETVRLKDWLFDGTSYHDAIYFQKTLDGETPHK